MKKLNKKNLSRLTFWTVHIVGIVAVGYGFAFYFNMGNVEKTLLAGYENCVKTSTTGTASYCSTFLGSISNYNENMFNSFLLGLGLLVGYWVIRVLYKYLFKEEQETPEGEDSLYEEAKEIVIKSGKASPALLQRRLRIGYSRSARLIDMLEENGVVGEADGAKPREILKDN